jgi:hypothetical protein
MGSLDVNQNPAARLDHGAFMQVNQGFAKGVGLEKIACGHN